MPIYMKFDGIDGEVTDAGHVNEIEVLGWAWAESQTAGGTGAVRRAKPVIQDLVITKGVDKSTPKLILAAAQATSIVNAQLTVARTVGDANVDYLTVKMTNLLISSYSVSGDNSNGSRPTEKVEINFTKVEFNYVPLSPTGAPGKAEIAIIDKTGK